MKYAGILIPLGTIGIAVLLLFGWAPDDYFLQNLGSQTPVMEELFKLQRDKNLTSEALFVVNSRIQGVLNSSGQPSRQNLFLSTYASTHPQDPFLTYYYYMVAENYRTQKADDFAALYYDRVLRNYQDLTYKGISLHRASLEKLIQIVQDPSTRLGYLNEWTQRFSDPAVLPRMQYYLGKTYESLGEYEKAQEAFKAFINQPGTIIPGEPQAWKNTIEYVDFFRSNKAWVRPTLESLVSSLKDAFARVDMRAIETLRSKRGFTVVTWSTMEAKAQTDDDSRQFVATQVRKSSGIGITGDFHRDSSDREVYLRSTGWGYSLSPIFYIYLKKVDFLPNPEINGGWEWAGLFMGEKL
ncbi:MAG: hypothetical protein A2Z96_02210 [Spirochaetes bacterium GWB1_48_6]|nr:MAG: hypothetical protein A2Z96_02210 [Spirochaetes bacterium GWB1_48_6]